MSDPANSKPAPGSSTKPKDEESMPDIYDHMEDKVAEDMPTLKPRPAGIAEEDSDRSEGFDPYNSGSFTASKKSKRKK